MSDTELVLVTREANIAIVTMNNPDRMNVYSPTMRRALLNTFTTLIGEPDLRAIVLTGAGRNFSAGGDIKAWDKIELLEARLMLQESQALIKTIVAGPKPVITAVEGYAYGAGMGLASASDYVVAASDAKFAAAFIKIGLLPDLGSMWTLPQRIGLGRAKEMLGLGAPIDATEAHRLGLVNRLVEPGQALPAALEIARQYAEGPPLAHALLKAAFANGMPTLPDTWRTELDYVSIAFTSEDFQEGRKAFSEKRKPVYRGK